MDRIRHIFVGHAVIGHQCHSSFQIQAAVIIPIFDYLRNDDQFSGRLIGINVSRAFCIQRNTATATVGFICQNRTFQIPSRHQMAPDFLQVLDGLRIAFPVLIFTAVKQFMIQAQPFAVTVTEHGTGQTAIADKQAVLPLRGRGFVPEFFHHGCFHPSIFR